MYEDLHWLGLDWDEGPDISGPFAPYSQSERREFYLKAWRQLRDNGFIYPCSCSRKDMERALQAPHEESAHHEEDDEMRYPGTCRARLREAGDWEQPAGISWRFRVPDDELIRFQDLYFGAQEFTGGKDFSDFLVWRRDDVPSYQLAVVVDDSAMRITEVVRGADLLKSTARQLLLFRAFRMEAPRYFHCPLLRDEHDVRLAKRHDALSLRTLRIHGVRPESLQERFAAELEWKRNLRH